jgi:pleiotropic regulator 1
MAGRWSVAAGKGGDGLVLTPAPALRISWLCMCRFTFASGSADNIKKWRYPNGDFMLNMDPHKAVVNAMAVNADDVMVTAGTSVLCSGMGIVQHAWG